MKINTGKEVFFCFWFQVTNAVSSSESILVTTGDSRKDQKRLREIMQKVASTLQWLESVAKVSSAMGVREAATLRCMGRRY